MKKQNENEKNTPRCRVSGKKDLNGFIARPRVVHGQIVIFYYGEYARYHYYTHCRLFCSGLRVDKTRRRTLNAVTINAQSRRDKTVLLLRVVMRAPAAINARLCACV